MSEVDEAGQGTNGGTTMTGTPEPTTAAGRDTLNGRFDTLHDAILAIEREAAETAKAATLDAYARLDADIAAIRADTPPLDVTPERLAAATVGTRVHMDAAEARAILARLERLDR